MKDILKLQELKYIYKFKKEQLPHYLQNLRIRYNSETHKHYTWTQDNKHVGQTAHEYANRSIRYKLPLTVNSTPIEILSKNDTHKFKRFCWIHEAVLFEFLSSYLYNS